MLLLGVVVLVVLSVVLLIILLVLLLLRLLPLLAAFCLFVDLNHLHLGRLRRVVRLGAMSIVVRLTRWLAVGGLQSLVHHCCWVLRVTQVGWLHRLWGFGQLLALVHCIPCAVGVLAVGRLGLVHLLVNHLLNPNLSIVAVRHIVSANLNQTAPALTRHVLLRHEDLGARRATDTFQILALFPDNEANTLIRHLHSHVRGTEGRLLSNVNDWVVGLAVLFDDALNLILGFQVPLVFSFHEHIANVSAFNWFLCDLDLST